MSSTSSTYHIPFPKNFLAVNTRPKKTVLSAALTSPVANLAPHGFLSNVPTSSIPHRHQSISSISSITSVATSDTAASDASTISAPSSPRTKPADSPILGPKIFAPLQVNAKHALPPKNAGEMSAAERQRRMSFEKHTFLSNRH
ncbi:hypothetical protein IAQ61_000824 [Plenodomus lingam]|uniref:Uncharacterized protein n=1 Tax=Leptosphaeria maculans (strain JN3 / isolate v23.1.3 / race Av1-4-5-6-7-8) TaxID=985895 RepID=E5A600_LEPMJ|nr:hypothetical protein LEMA_P082840.1 [Plenodomus lingam JN3]KAH9880531.1 hypothetical protein IAQ61_000824 [Plenodomus lingam]CBX99045.1 hypothetical protein LEMA_P082840.1 [Plenodomus lingam JN3]